VPIGVNSWPQNPVNHISIHHPGDSTFLAVSAGNLTPKNNKIPNQYMPLNLVNPVNPVEKIFSSWHLSAFARVLNISDFLPSKIRANSRQFAAKKNEPAHFRNPNFKIYQNLSISDHF
jgi:hypothetical protein